VAHSTRPDLEPATKAEVRRLRTLLRDRHARDGEGVFVCEGPRVISAAFEHGADLIECFVGATSSPDVRAVVDRAAASGMTMRKLAAPVGDTVTPQPVFATARLRRSRDASGLDLAVVGAVISDPGNAGTLVRSAAASGAQAVIFGAGSVDAYNPKVVRASAGACFAVRIVEGVPAVEILEALGADQVRRIGAAADGGAPPESFDLRERTAIVVGHEVRGLTPELPLDGVVTIPMQSHESLNVAMAGSVLLFEAARQRRTA
jgi:RNA methyltransferase, TrmH family